MVAKIKVGLTLVFVWTSLVTFGQISESGIGDAAVTYFKSLDQNKTVSKRKGKYKRVISSQEDGITKIEFIEMSSNIVRKEYYLDHEQPVGVWREFDAKGKLTNERDLDAIEYCEETKKVEKDTSDYTIIDPVFEGGDSKMYAFLGNHLKYPQYAVNHNISGKVRVQFVIEKYGGVTSGCITNHKKKSNRLLEYEALRVVASMPNWEPGEVDGEPVRVKFNLPISFKLN